MKEQTKDQCHECKFWVSWGDSGDCRRRSPIISKPGSVFTGGWPTTSRHDSCGDFEAALRPQTLKRRWVDKGLEERRKSGRTMIYKGPMNFGACKCWWCQESKSDASTAIRPSTESVGASPEVMVSEKMVVAGFNEWSREEALFSDPHKRLSAIYRAMRELEGK